MQASKVANCQCAFTAYYHSFRREEDKEEGAKVSFKISKIVVDDDDDEEEGAKMSFKISQIQICIS